MSSLITVNCGQGCQMSNLITANCGQGCQMSDLIGKSKEFSSGQLSFYSSKEKLCCLSLSQMASLGQTRKVQGSEEDFCSRYPLIQMCGLGL